MKKSIIYLAAFVAFVLTMPVNANAQLQVTGGSSLPSGWTADSLVRNVLLGEGVEISNVRFNGSQGVISCNSIGKFTTGNNSTNLGMEQGIIMGTGGVSLAVGPNNSGSSSTTGCAGYVCAPLAALTTFTMNDCAVLEFDFVPKNNKIEFQYVFASEEYPEYVCSDFNDIFGFFLTGVNPLGGMYNNTNIALVPNSTTTIAINHVNGGVAAGSTTPCILTNTAYYVNNSGGTTIQYDGFTTVLTATARVVPCTQYHLTMAIADLSDGSYDSGVFLKAGSLTSNAITFTFENRANPHSPSDLYEGCLARVKLSRPQATSQATRIDLSIEGTVINGYDFPQLNPFFYFPAGVDTVSFVISPYKDNEVEGIETCKIVLSPEDGCPRSDSVQFNILDVADIVATIERDTLTSATNQIQLRSVITGGMAEHAITWVDLISGSTRVGPNITVSTFPDSWWLLRVSDSCYNYGEDTMLIGVRRNFAMPSHDTIICAGEPLRLSVTGADSTSWYVLGSDTPIAVSGDTIDVAPTEMTFYQIRSYKYWNNQYWEDIDTLRVSVVPLPEIHVSASVTRLCKGNSVTLTATGTDMYSWDGGQTFVTASSHTYTPDTTTMFVIKGHTASAECHGRDSILIVVDTVPSISFGDASGVCDGEDVSLTVYTDAPSFRWVSEPEDYTMRGQESNSTILVNPSVTTVYTVNAVNGECSNSASTTVAVEPNPIAIGEVTPRTVSLGQMEAVFTDMSQHSTTRKWEFPDGVVRTDKEVSYIVPDDVDSIAVRLWAYNPYLCFDTTTVTVYVDHTTLWAPNAFTPDESTNNTFLVKMQDIQRYHIFIYDRAGRLVFESTDPEKPWDGTGQNGQKCPQGVYAYLISCHKITYPYDQIVKKGTVVLVR